MTDPLAKLFGSEARLKLLRLFLFNPKTSFTVPEVAQRSRIREREARREMTALIKMGLVRRARRGARALGRRFTLKEDFPYVEMLQQLLLNPPERAQDIAEHLRRVGTIKLVVLSGIFVGEWDGRLDLLVVGDRIKERKLRDYLRRLESELGRELRFAALTSEDFFYRLNMSDHLVRDILDYPHRIVLDKLQIGLK